MYGLIPIEFYNVNDFQPVAAWELPNGAPITLAMVLTKNDAMGTRRFLPPAGSLVQLQFVRARAATATSQAVTLMKTAIALPEDKSMFQITLTADDTKNIISGGVQLSVTIGGVQNLVNLPYIIKKKYCAPGY